LGLTLALGIALPGLETPALGKDKSAISDRSASSRYSFQTQPVRFKNWGIANGQSQSHVQAVDAWGIERGNREIIVAVIDTGVDANHPDLKTNIWEPTRKNAQKSGYGWNFVRDNSQPTDDHGHGTHVAGIIGAIANPESGVSGVAQNVSIMAVKYYSENASGAVNLANTVKAIDYAVKNGARIINYSGGGPEFSEEEYLAIRRAELAGVLVVAAAGNEHQDTDQVENYYYPSAYRLSNIISVAATDIHNRLIRSSNWGARRVDVAAPGENIYSTLPNGKYGYMTGTSQATAFVSGIAALLLSKNPKLTPIELKKLILDNVDRFPTLAGKVATSGRVNAFKSLLALETSGKRTGRSQSLASKSTSRPNLSTWVASRKLQASDPSSARTVQSLKE
jgi:subtilisin family serine protease